jgi:acid phosphatase type 7
LKQETIPVKPSSFAFEPSRRDFLARSGLLLGATCLTEQTAIARQAPTDEMKFGLLCHPVLTNPAPDAVSVLWATNGAATGWVEYGESDQLGERASGEEQGLMPYDERAFKVRLRQLKAGTRYYYRVHAVRVDFRGPYDIRRRAEESSVSDVFSFTTPNPEAESTRFTVWNDTHEVQETLRGLHDAHEKAQEQEPDDFLLWNGDQTNDISTEERMVDQFLAAAGRPFAARVPYYYVRGNHDVRGPGARRLPRFTDVPDSAYFYSFRQGPLGALVLDTGEDKPDDHPVYGGLNNFAAFRTRQAEWLAKAIERPEFRTAPFRVLFCHIPLWWQDRPLCTDGHKKWHDLLVKGGVQLVISGHTHRPGWFPPEKGRPYGQLVAGGPKPTAATYIHGHVSRERLAISHYKLNGDVLHQFEIG